MDYEKVSDREWEEMVLKSDNAYFFSSPAWAKIIEKSYTDYRTDTRLYQINDKSILVPMMEKKVRYGFKYFESMPEGYGGLFSESEVTTDEFRSIVEDIIGNRHILYMPLHPFEDIKPGKSVIEEWKVKDEWNYMHIIDIDGKSFESIWNSYHSRLRGSIRKAIKSGVEVREGTSLEDYKEFYDIWCKASQKWGYDTPPHPLEFFSNLYKYGSSNVKLTLATKDDQNIAGAISFHYSKTIFGYFSAFLPEYGTFNPTSLLYNDIIKQACEEGICKYINSGHSVQNEGLKKYKEGFGAEEVEIERYLAFSKLALALTKVNKFL